MKPLNPEFEKEHLDRITHKYIAMYIWKYRKNNKIKGDDKLDWSLAERFIGNWAKEYALGGDALLDNILPIYFN
jgi:hypothetical protein